MSRREAYLSSTVCMDVIESLASLNICARAAGLSGNSQKSINRNHITWWRTQCTCTISTVCLKLMNTSIVNVLVKITLGGETTETSSPNSMTSHGCISKVSTGYHHKSAMHSWPTAVHQYKSTVHLICTRTASPFAHIGTCRCTCT